LKRRKIFRILDRYFGIPIVLLLRLFNFNFSKNLPKETKKIIFVKFAAVGDIVLLIPTLKLLKKKFPDAEIDFLCTNINSGIIKTIPFLDNVIVCKVYDFIKNPFYFLRFVKMLRKKQYDLLIDAEQWSRIDAIISFFIRKKFSVGFRTKNQFRHYNYSVSVNHSRFKHESENFIELLNPLGLKAKEEDKVPEFYLTAEDVEFAENYWEENDLSKYEIICFQPSCGTGSFAREWKEENYSSLGRKILEYDPEIRFFLTGTKSDFDKCQRIVYGIGKNAENLAGKFSMGKDLAIIRKSDLLICSNTGILHMAAAIGAKTIGLHGPNNPEQWGAYSGNAEVILSDIFCSPCLYLGHEYRCNAPVCMPRIKVEDVYLKVRDILEKD